MRNVFEVYEEVFKPFFPKLRPSQEEILKKYEKIRDDKKIIDIDAPPGTGKSLINMIIALAEDDLWGDIYDKIVVSSFSKALQQQYVDSFREPLKKKDISFALGVGVSSFICMRFKKVMPFCAAALGYGCAYFPKIFEGKYKDLLKLINIDEDVVFFGTNLPFSITNPDVRVKAMLSDINCYYFMNEYKVYSSKVIFSNHHYLITHLLHSETLPYPSVLIIDEAHTFPRTFSEENTLVIDKKLGNFLEEIKLVRFSEIINVYSTYLRYPDFIEMLTDLNEILQDALKNTKGDLRLKLYDLISVSKVHRIIIQYVMSKGEPLEKYFIISRFSDKLVVTPSYHAYLAMLEYLSLFVKYKIILSSATLPPKKYSPSEVRISSYKDMYPFINRPIFYIVDAPDITNRTVGNVGVQRYILSLVKSLWSKKNFRKIVIHSVNNFIRDFIGSLLRKEGFPVVITDNLKEDIEKWKNMDEGIIISAGMEEGVDLKYDLARIQIIIKMPLYDTRKDVFIRHLMKYDKDLYNYYIALRLVQMSGRICRAKDDIGITVILDKRAISHYSKYNYLYPIYYKKAVRFMSTAGFFKVLDSYNVYISSVNRAAKKYGRPLPDTVLDPLIKNFIDILPSTPSVMKR